MTQKPTYEEYLDECLKELNVADAQKASKAFEFNMRAAAQSLHSSYELKTIIAALNNAKTSYAHDRPELLFFPSDAPDKTNFLSKSFDSTIDKLYRRNVLLTKNIPHLPRKASSKRLMFTKT
ncbi:hypothetical protein FE840_013805 [Peteryoungia desertarenae]|uniref:Uncharacterized protein n=1 Tax=Peteryoungia desertarenae TaxID=1813451 RepID=A0ABX6QQJ4_9HYPH|nr:hypothetical protein [Peteryoungia desertarenae]QLF70522.1 hypothetical protein FE840_013805 [Peteryoungia desertarenae]